MRRKFLIVGVIALVAGLVICWNFGSLMVRAAPSEVPVVAGLSTGSRLWQAGRRAAS